MKKLVILLILTLLFQCCEKSENEPQNIENYLNERTVFEITANADASKIFFLSGIIDTNAPPYMCSVPYIYQLSCTDGVQVLTFENLHSIRNIAVDNSCNVYACSVNSLIKFTPPHDSITIKTINSGFSSVAVGNNGKVWAGTWEDGLYSYDGNIWRQFTTENSILPDNYISQVYCSNNNIVWLILDDQDRTIIRIIGNDWKKYTINTLPESAYLYASTCDYNGIFYTSYYSNNCSYLYKFTEEGFNTISLPVAIRNSFISRLKTDQDGNLYFVINYGDFAEVYCMKSNDWYKINIPDVTGYIHDIVIDKSNYLWIGTGSGVKKIFIQLIPIN